MNRVDQLSRRTEPVVASSRRSRLLRLLATSLVAIAVPAMAAAPASAEGKSFLEEFDTLDDSRWFVSDGWNNGDHQGCMWTADSVTPVDGFLRLSLAPRPAGDRDYSCGEVQTREFYRYGVYEARMRTVSSPGTVSAFFTYTGPAHDNPWDEVDVEILGKDTTQAQLNIYVDGEGGHEKLIDLGFDSAESMNDYAFVWEPDALRWYVNGELVREMTSDEQTLPSVASKIYLSVWNGQGEGMKAWLGPFDPPGGPMHLDVARVAYTAPGDPCQFPESIVCAEE